MGFLEFLRDIGKYARVGTMLAKDSVKTRLNSEQGISYTEFTYQLLQGYDFVHLHKEHGVSVQVGAAPRSGGPATSAPAPFMEHRGQRLSKGSSG